MKIGLSRLSQIAIRRESTYGTLPVAITKGLLVSNFIANITRKVERVPQLTGMRQNALAMGGGYYVDISFTLYAGTMSATAASLAEMLVMVFDTDTITGASDPYTHTFTLSEARSLPSFSINHLTKSGNESKQIQYTGFRINTLTLALDKESGAIACEVVGMAIKEESTLAGDQVAVYNTDPLFSSALIDIKVNGTSFDRYKTASIEFNNLAEVFAPLSGARNAKEVYPKGFECSVKFDGLTDMVNSPDLRAAFTSDVINDATNSRAIAITFGNGTADRLVTINIPAWIVNKAENFNITEADAIPESIEIMAINEADSSKNVSITYTGSVSSSYNNLS